MFQPWRQQIRKAEESLSAGRLNEAAGLLCQGDLRQFLPAIKLSAKVGCRLAERGRKNCEQGDIDAAWRDLETALTLGVDLAELSELKQCLVDSTIEEARAFLEAGDPRSVIDRLASLERRKIATAEIRTLREVADKWNLADGLHRRGDFAKAEAEYATAVSLLPGVSALEKKRRLCQEALVEGRALMEQLHEALSREAWTEVLGLADRLIAMAPDNPPARSARRRAWAAVGTNLRDSISPAIDHRFKKRPERAPEAQPLAAQRAEAYEPGPRFVLWVDEVGGYLVCQGEEIVIGQPVPGNSVDIPILADLSRRHATIRRESEGYTILPGREIKLDGEPVKNTALLMNGNVIELGSGVRLKFRQPHALSATARLEFASRHRTQPSVDGILLMAGTLILGPQLHNHIICKRWPAEVVIFRDQSGLYCRTNMPFEVDGASGHERALLTDDATVSGNDFAFSLEPVKSTLA